MHYSIAWIALQIQNITPNSFVMDKTVSLHTFICWSPIPQQDSVWRWDLWEVMRVSWGLVGGTLMMGLEAVLEEEGEALSAKWGQNEEAISKTWSRILSRTQSASTFILIGLSSPELWEMSGVQTVHFMHFLIPARIA